MQIPFDGFDICSQGRLALQTAVAATVESRTWTVAKHLVPLTPAFIGYTTTSCSLRQTLDAGIKTIAIRTIVKVNGCLNSLPNQCR